MARTTIGEEPVGGPVETVLGFVNSRADGTGRTERFGSAADFSAWARERGLIGDETVSESEAVAARELRAALLMMLLAHSAHQEATPEQIMAAERQLTHAAGLYPVRIAISAAGSTVTGHNRGAAHVFGDVLAAANEIIQRGDWHRMKACCSHPCRHGFMDRTKNGAQMYCGSTCSSRAAMRTMRERRRTQQDTSPTGT
ncbi:ABATE domain-containing protein [Herbidospora sp. RD11066]